MRSRNGRRRKAMPPLQDPCISSRLYIREKRGDGGFGYDPYFYYEPLGKTFAELTTEEKNAVSHRGEAIRAFGKRFAEEI